MENWKIIENFPDYMVSDQGRFKGLKEYRQYKSGRILKPKLYKTGYLYIGLYKDRKRYFKRINRLVLETFKGVDPIKPFCNHKDGNKENNWLYNLEWTTQSENEKHAYKLGLKNQEGENHNLSKLKYGEVYLIKRILQSDLYKKRRVNQVFISKMFNVNHATISAINKEKIWKNIL